MDMADNEEQIEFNHVYRVPRDAKKKPKVGKEEKFKVIVQGDVVEYRFAKEHKELKKFEVEKE